MNAGQAGKKGQGGQGSQTDPADGKIVADLRKQVADLEAQLKKLTDVAARAQADLQNAKMRMEKDGEELRRFASQAVMLKLLPVIDNFQRAFRHLPEELKAHAWVGGVTAIEQELLKQAGELGLKRFESLGRRVDAARHEVLMEGPGEKGIITEVFEDGYELNGKVIRVAKVRVGSGEPHPVVQNSLFVA